MNIPRNRFLVLALFSAFVAHISRGQSVEYDGRLGLIGSQYTGTAGEQLSTVTGVSGEFFKGASRRYSATGGNLGNSAWIATGSQTIGVGLTGGIFGGTNAPGSSEVNFVTSHGASAGTSAYTPGGTYAGDATWLANSTGTSFQVGLFSAPFARSDGFRMSSVSGLTDSGFAWGASTVYSGTSVMGQGTWVATGSATNRVGLTGAGYVSTAGAQSSTITGVNISGMSIGTSDRYSANVNLGIASWKAAPGGISSLIGQYDSAHLRSDGYAFSQALFLSDTGFVAGYSNLYTGATAKGQTAWRIAPNGTLTQVGYVSSDYSDGGTFYSAITGLDSLGNAIGLSTRNSAGGYANTGFYLTNSGSVTNVGLTGSPYTNAQGFTSSRPNLITNSGYVAGQSSQYNLGTYVGAVAFVQNVHSGTAIRVGIYPAQQTDNTVAYLRENGGSAGYAGGLAWAATSGGTTIQIGNYSSAFSVGGNFQSQLSGMTDSCVWGISTRASGGYAGWLFNLDSGTQISLADIDIVSPAGFGQSAFLGVNDDGSAYGFYYSYDASGQTDGRVAFIYNLSSGIISVGGAVGDISQYGWTGFEDAYLTASGAIAGNGALTGGSLGVYGANVVPEPSILALMALAGVALAFTSRRRRRE
ncbi:hypothetical protein BH09VER1_BH09VER1_47380 [soil metagenome]